MSSPRAPHRPSALPLVLLALLGLIPAAAGLLLTFFSMFGGDTGWLPGAFLIWVLVSGGWLVAMIAATGRYARHTDPDSVRRLRDKCLVYALAVHLIGGVLGPLLSYQTGSVGQQFALVFAIIGGSGGVALFLGFILAFAQRAVSRPATAAPLRVAPFPTHQTAPTPAVLSCEFCHAPLMLLDGACATCGAAVGGL